MFEKILKEKFKKDYGSIREKIGGDYNSAISDEFWVELLAALMIDKGTRKKRQNYFKGILKKYKKNDHAFTKILSYIIGDISGDYLKEKFGNKAIAVLKNNFKKGADEAYNELFKEDFYNVAMEKI